MNQALKDFWRHQFYEYLSKCPFSEATVTRERVTILNQFISFLQKNPKFQTYPPRAVLDGFFASVFTWGVNEAQEIYGKGGAA
jgi:hypothetical protein